MSLAVSTSEHRSNSAARLALMRSPGPGPAAATYAATRRKAAQLRRAIAHPEVGRIDKHGHPYLPGGSSEPICARGSGDSSFLDPAASMLQMGATASNVGD